MVRALATSLHAVVDILCVGILPSAAFVQAIPNIE